MPVFPGTTETCGLGCGVLRCCARLEPPDVPLRSNKAADGIQGPIEQAMRGHRQTAAGLEPFSPLVACLSHKALYLWPLWHPPRHPTTVLGLGNVHELLARLLRALDPANAYQERMSPSTEGMGRWRRGF